MALKPGKSSSKCLFFVCFLTAFGFGFVGFFFFAKHCCSTAHLSAISQRRSHKKSAVQAIGDVQCLRQAVGCLRTCCSVSSTSALYRHSAVPCRVWGRLCYRRSSSAPHFSNVPQTKLLDRTIRLTFTKEAPPLPRWASRCISGYLHCLVSCFRRK